MNVLVVNAGSSSLKYQLFDTDTDSVTAKGNCERIGIDGRITHQSAGKDVYKAEIAMPNHTEATKIVVKALTDPTYGCIHSMSEIGAVGHRVVHGGPYFSESVLVTDDVIEKLKLCMDLAPLHTGPHLMGIQGCKDAMPDTPQVLVFDTAFHQTMPETSYFYGLPYELYEKYGIRRYGFHGTSHRYVTGEMLKILNKPVENTKIITCHLGNGSSIAAVMGGKVLDTTMGFTPLDGLMMGTRCGSIDPALVTFIMEKEKMTAAEVNQYLNKEAGLYGVSGVSSDCRDLVDAMEAGNPRAKLALEMLGYQIRKYIGAYAAAMNGVDAVVFTAGIGENNKMVRKLALTGLSYLGIEFDEEASDAVQRPAPVTKLSKENSRVLVYLIPTNEELVIANDTAKIVGTLNNN